MLSDCLWTNANETNASVTHIGVCKPYNSNSYGDLSSVSFHYLPNLQVERVSSLWCHRMLSALSQVL